MLLAIIAARGLKLWLIDFVGAYLNAEPQGDNYLKIPEGFESHYTIPGVDTVLLMNLTIYGTMDGANNWFRKLNGTFNQLGHRQSRADPCVRTQHTEEGTSITSTYTDDVLGGSTTDEAMNRTKRELAEKYEITDLGRPNKILGMSIIYNEITGDISIHQKPLIMKALAVFGMENANPKYTPLPPNLNLTDSQPHPISPEDVLYMKDKDYRGALGMTNHLGNGTRADIAVHNAVLMRYASDPRPIHWRLVLHLLAYLKTTIDLVITYRKGGDIKPYGYSDSSFADDPDSRKSTAGHVFMVAGGPVGWKAKTQCCVSTSTGEAEFVGVFEGGKQAKWMYSWFTEVDIYVDRPITVFCDNNAAVALTQNTGGHSRIKHVNVKTHWIREAVACGDIHVHPISTEENVADLFTKSLPRAKLEYLIKKMGMEFLEG